MTRTDWDDARGLLKDVALVKEVFSKDAKNTDLLAAINQLHEATKENTRVLRESTEATGKESRVMVVMTRQMLWFTIVLTWLAILTAGYAAISGGIPFAPNLLWTVGSAGIAALVGWTITRFGMPGKARKRDAS